MFIRTTVAILCLGWFFIPTHADEPKKYEPIDPETVVVYEKLGARYGGFCGERSQVGVASFARGKEATATGLPAFELTSLRDGTLPKLPPVSVPFGLDLSNTRVTDAGLRELMGLTNLTTLDLGAKHLTLAQVKEFKESLPNCKIKCIVQP